MCKKEGNLILPNPKISFQYQSDDIIPLSDNITINTPNLHQKLSQKKSVKQLTIDNVLSSSSLDV